MKRIALAKDYKTIMALAQQYGVADNVLFASAAERYVQQMDLIREMRAKVLSEGLMMESLNTNRDAKREAHPLIAQISKYQDTSNKTLGQMVDIIIRLGQKPEKVEDFVVD